jgi:hypothetical protein
MTESYLGTKLLLLIPCQRHRSRRRYAEASLPEVVAQKQAKS